MKMAIIPLLFLFVGCAALKAPYQQQRPQTNRDVLDSWMGGNKANLVNTWGVPHRTIDLDGQEIYEYQYCQSRGGYTLYGSDYSVFARNVPIPTRQDCQVWTFWIENNVIVKGAYR